MTSHEGGCLCGQVRFRLTAPPLSSGYCHCRICQKNSGSPVVAWVTFPAPSFEWLAGTAQTYASSRRGRRQFCANCGSYLLFRDDEAPEEVSVNTASFDDPGAFPPQMHIFIESRIPWFHIDDVLPAHRGYGPFKVAPTAHPRHTD